jgi:prepilin-type N-terminal cleavage/methylation domain-containing protein
MMSQVTPRGFSMVELMMVVAIIAILASIAMPKYQTYVQRSHVSTSLSLVRPIQLALLEYLSHYGELPANDVPLAAFGISRENGQFESGLVSSVKYMGGAKPYIDIHFRKDANTPSVLRGKFISVAVSATPSGLLRFSISKRSTVAEELWPRI